jgi:hypothetical protein
MRKPTHPLPTVEQQHPWLRWGYAAAVAAGLLLSAAFPAGCAHF